MEIVKIKSQVKVQKKGGMSFGCYTSKSLKCSSCLAYRCVHLFMASQEDLHFLCGCCILLVDFVLGRTLGTQKSNSRSVLERMVASTLEAHSGCGVYRMKQPKCPVAGYPAVQMSRQMCRR